MWVWGVFGHPEEMLGRQVDTWTQRSGEIGQFAARVGGVPGIVGWGETGSRVGPPIRSSVRFSSSVSSRSAGSRVLPLVFAPSRHSPSLPVPTRFLPLEPGSHVTGSVDRSSRYRDDTFTWMFPPEAGEVNILRTVVLHPPDLENVLSTPWVPRRCL